MIFLHFLFQYLDYLRIPFTHSGCRSPCCKLSFFPHNSSISHPDRAVLWPHPLYDYSYPLYLFLTFFTIFTLLLASCYHSQYLCQNFRFLASTCSNFLVVLSLTFLVVLPVLLFANSTYLFSSPFISVFLVSGLVPSPPRTFPCPSYQLQWLLSFPWFYLVYQLVSPLPYWLSLKTSLSSPFPYPSLYPSQLSSPLFCHHYLQNPPSSDSISSASYRLKLPVPPYFLQAGSTLLTPWWL